MAFPPTDAHGDDMPAELVHRLEQALVSAAETITATVAAWDRTSQRERAAWLGEDVA